VVAELPTDEVPGAVVEQAAAVPDPGPAPLSRSRRVFRRHSASSLPRRRRGCAEYDLDWAAVSASPAVSFSEQVEGYLSSVVPAEWHGFAFHFDLNCSATTACHACCGPHVARFVCTRCSSPVCISCSYTHLFDHLSDFEKQALCDDVELHGEFRCIFDGCCQLAL